MGILHTNRPQERKETMKRTIRDVCEEAKLIKPKKQLFIFKGELKMAMINNKKLVRTTRTKKRHKNRSTQITLEEKWGLEYKTRNSNNNKKGRQYRSM